MPYAETVLNSRLELKDTGDSDAYISLYREALNTNSPAYRFLCMYKIIEGILARRRRTSTRPTEGKGNGYRAEAIPKDVAECAKWLEELFDRKWDEKVVKEVVHPEVWGKKFNYIGNAFLHPIRVRIAHSVVRGGEPTLTADEPSHLSAIYHWLPLTQCLARQMFKNEFPEDF